MGELANHNLQCFDSLRNINVFQIRLLFALAVKGGQVIVSTTPLGRSNCNRRFRRYYKLSQVEFMNEYKGHKKILTFPF